METLKDIKNKCEESGMDAVIKGENVEYVEPKDRCDRPVELTGIDTIWPEGKPLQRTFRDTFLGIDVIV